MRWFQDIKELLKEAPGTVLWGCTWGIWEGLAEEIGTKMRAGG